MATTTRNVSISWGLAGVTLGVTVLAADGSTLIARSTAGVVAQGSGQYLASIVSWDLTWGAWVVIDDGADTAAGTESLWLDPLSPTVNGELIQTTSDGHVEATDEIGGSLATPLANLDAAVSSRLPASSYTTPPTVDAIAAAVDAATPADVPTVAQIAAGVRDVDNSAPAVGSLGAATNTAATRTTVNVTPIQASVSNPRYATRDLPPIAQNSAPLDQWTVTNAAGQPIDLTGKTLRMVIAKPSDACRDPFDAGFVAIAKYETGDGVTLGGDGNNVVSVQQSARSTATAGHYRYWLLNVTDSLPISQGQYPVQSTVWDT